MITSFLRSSPETGPEPSPPTAAVRRRWLRLVVVAAAGLGAATTADAQDPVIRVGIIGLDTSHAPAFTALLNRAGEPDHVPGARVVAAVPQGSRDIESSVKRVPEYTAAVRGLGVEIVPSIAALLERVDAVMLESNDGRVHLEQAAAVLAARKPVFIDKPLAASLADAIAIFKLAARHGTPVFSASSLRFGPATQAVRNGSIGPVLGCDTYSPCQLEPTHPDLFWYGIHGCEALFTVMGTGCRSVARTSTAEAELVTGVWDQARIGSYRGIRAGTKAYGGTAFGGNGIAPVGESVGYRPLVVEIVRFFATGKSPVLERETVEILAFMEGADESRRRGGSSVALGPIIAHAEAKAERLVAGRLQAAATPPAAAAAP